MLAYELINEPFVGDFYSDPVLIVPGVADKRLLQPLYEKLHTTIRQVGDQHMIMFEPITFDYVPVGFTQ